jgi:GH18 family chitinase
MIPPSVFDGPNGIDGISIMTYELGWWANDPNDFNRGEHSLPEYVEDSVDAWTEPVGSQNRRTWVFNPWGNNAPEDKLGIGLPFFGRVIGTSQMPMAGTAYTYSELSADGTTMDGNYYMYQGQPVWIPGPELASQRVEFAHERGLQHVIIWEIGQDLHPSNPNSLLRAAYEAQQSLLGLDGDYNDDGKVDAADYVVWRQNEGTTNALPNDPHGETIGANQYNTWRANYGMTQPASGGGTIAVPEPVACWLLMTAALLPVTRHRRRGAPRENLAG